VAPTSSSTEPCFISALMVALFVCSALLAAAGVEATITPTNSGILPETHSLLWALAALAVLVAVVYFFLVKPAIDQNRRHAERLPCTGIFESMVINHDSNDEIEIRMHDPFDEDAYSLAIALIVRDLYSLASGKAQKKGLRYTRLLFSVGLIALTVSLQVAILAGTKHYVTPQQVADIRDSYDKYELIMYGKGNTIVNRHGKHRGIEGFFNASSFVDLKDKKKGGDGDLQKNVCNIPLSQLNFIGLVLLVWSITCMAQLKKCVENFVAIVFFAQTKRSMAEALTEFMDDDDDGDEGGSDINDGIPIQVITGLTWPVKVMMIFCIFLPDMLTTLYVLWLGSRWLVATNDFGNLLSNAVALEFILALKCLLFYALVSERNKRDLRHTGLAPSWDKEPAGFGIYFSSIVWAVAAFCWVYYYVHHQQVLPDYKWDITAVCTPWLQSQLDPSN